MAGGMLRLGHLALAVAVLAAGAMAQPLLGMRQMGKPSRTISPGGTITTSGTLITGHPGGSAHSTSTATLTTTTTTTAPATAEGTAAAATASPASTTTTSSSSSTPVKKPEEPAAPAASAPPKTSTPAVATSPAGTPAAKVEAAAAAVPAPVTLASSASSLPPNPKDAFARALQWPNVYLTPNWFVGAYHYIQCYAGSLVLPENTKQTADAIKYWYNKAQQGMPVTIRMSRPKFHTSTTFVCPISPLSAAPAPAVNVEAGSRQPITVGLLHNKMNKVLAADKQKYTMRVQGGITYTEFLKEATKAGMSVVVGTPTAYAGLTLSGVLATTAHGSGDKTVSTLWDTLLEITWVDGKGEVHVSKPADPEFRGMVGSVGTYGVITEFLIQMTPPSATTLITVRKNDTNMLKDIEELLKISPHILVFWRPDISTFKAFLVNPAKPDAKVTPDAQMVLLPNLKDQQEGARTFKLLSETTDDDSEAFNFLCPIQTEASLSSSWAAVNGTGVWNVTGPTNQMQASECDEHCNWNENNTFFGTAQDVEFTAEFDQLGDWINDVKKIIKFDLFENGNKSFRCLSPGYLWIRFGRGYDGFTATTAGLKRPVFLQSTWLRSRATPKAPIRYQFVQDLIEQLTLCKYNARPHWGKNFDRTFTYPKCSTRAKYPKFNELLKLQSAYDPNKMFESRLFSKVINNEGFKLGPECALWQNCYCETDSNCPKGHKCIPALSFPEYKVCKSPNTDKPNSLLPEVFRQLAG